MLRPIWLVLLVPAVCAPAADAATVRTYIFEDCRGSIACSKYAGGTPEVGLTFEAAPGERNRVRATVSGGRVLIADDGAAVTAGEGCTQVTEQQADCRLPAAAGFALGDGDDAIEALGLRSVTLTGGEGADLLTGGAGNDRFGGGPGRDEVRAGAGDDELAGSAPGEPADLLDGGDGDDLLFYRGPGAAVVVLGPASAPAGVGPPTDTAVAVEGATGGSGDDVLVGGDAADTLDGGYGNDLVVGGAGEDRLLGGPGRDRLSGDAGDDVLLVGDGAADRASCGAGRDTVAGEGFDDQYGLREGTIVLDAGDLIARDCERTTIDAYATDDDSFPSISARVRLRGRIVTLDNPCPRRGACRGIVRVRAGAAAGFARYRSGAPRVRVRLTGGRPGSRVSVRVHGDRSARWTVDLRAPT